jgi:hypothetical protein
MGTSTSHRSPRDEAWEAVREVYEHPHPDAATLVSRIIAALDEVTSQRLHEPAPVICFEALLHTSLEPPPRMQENLTAPGAVPALALATEVRSLAEDCLSSRRLSTLIGDLALDALPPAVIDALGPGELWPDLSPAATLTRYTRYANERRLHQLANCFAARDLEQVFKYFVSRDVGDYVGTPSLPTVAESRRLLEDVGSLCRRRGSVFHPAVEATLREILTLSPVDRVTALEAVMGEGLRRGLNNLAND